MDIVYYFASYFATIHDNHKDTTTEKNSFEYIRNYYNSIMSLSGNIVCYIIHDHLDNSFVKRYQNKKIIFIKIDINDDNKLQPHDLRFIEIFKIIKNNPKIQYIFMTDISDCIVIKNGLPLLKNNNYLYICQEGENIYDNKWMENYLKYIYEKYFIDFTICQSFNGKRILNSGIVGGTRDLIIKFLEKLVMFINAMCVQKDGKPIDMIAINFIAYTYFPNLIYTGVYLHTRFGFREYNNSRYFKHK